MSLIPNTNLASFRQSPTKIANQNPITCILSNSDAAFYTVTPEKMSEIFEKEVENNKLDLALYTAYDCAISAMEMIDRNHSPDLFYILEQIVICYIGDEEFLKITNKQNRDFDYIPQNMLDVAKRSFINRKLFIENNTKTYVIKKSETNEVKIGKSLKVESRIKDISNTSGCDIDVLLVIDKNIENLMHKKFSHLRTIGEWFDDSSNEIQDFVSKGEQWIIEKFTDEGLI